MELTTWKKINGNTWHLISKYATPSLRAVLTRDIDKNYSVNITHLSEDFKLGQHKHRIGEAQTRAYTKYEEFAQVSKTEREEHCKLEKEGREERRQYESRAKIVRQLSDLYKNGVKNIAENVESLKEHAVTNGYRDGYHIMNRIMEAQGQVAAACHAIHILCRRDDGWKTFECDLLEEAARVYSGACSTSAMSNANDSAKGDALRNVASTFKWSDTLKAAFSKGWDFEFSIKAMLPKLFPENKVTA